MSKSHEHIIWVDNLVSATTGEPRVQLTFGETGVQLSVEEARDLAHNLLQGAEAAQSDAFVFEFVQTLGGAKLTEGQRAALVYEFRKFREQARK